ncbi:MAG: hypothetical protein ACRCUM_00525 [Mycoplasmoidaceae bacterium]
MSEEIKVEKLDAKIISDKKLRKENKENYSKDYKIEKNNLHKLPFIKLFLIMITLFLFYLAVIVTLITFGVISMHQNLWGGNLLNGFSSMPWGTILFIIGFLMLLPIIKYIKKVIQILIKNHHFNKDLKKIKEVKDKHGI